MLEHFDSTEWEKVFDPENQKRAVDSVEKGQIIYFPQLSFHLTREEIPFLSSDIAETKSKNISFLLRTQNLRGANTSQETQEKIKVMMERFANSAKKLIVNLFPYYANALQIGRTSFRPVEISNRVSSYRKDDTRLHVDAFPATPVQGWRILRVFTNINPSGCDRVWRIGEPFEKVVEQFLPHVSKPLPCSAKLLEILRITKRRRTYYDHVMLQIHDHMKANLDYQKTARQETLHFPPGSTWIVKTDHVSHAAMSGQHVLEQTFYLPVSAMVYPERSPLRVLERVMGQALV